MITQHIQSMTIQSQSMNNMVLWISKLKYSSLNIYINNTIETQKTLFINWSVWLLTQHSRDIPFCIAVKVANRGFAIGKDG